MVLKFIVIRNSIKDLIWFGAWHTRVEYCLLFIMMIWWCFFYWSSQSSFLLTRWWPSKNFSVGLYLPPGICVRESIICCTCHDAFFFDYNNTWASGTRLSNAPIQKDLERNRKHKAKVLTRYQHQYCNDQMSTTFIILIHLLLFYSVLLNK